jgi:hypothetical protein
MTTVESARTFERSFQSALEDFQRDQRFGRDGTANLIEAVMRAFQDATERPRIDPEPIAQESEATI